jgi:hypothetical protein
MPERFGLSSTIDNHLVWPSGDILHKERDKTEEVRDEDADSRSDNSKSVEYRNHHDGSDQKGTTVGDENRLGVLHCPE